MAQPEAHASDGPLRGLKVIDAGTMIAGPLAATHMADFGADAVSYTHLTLPTILRV